MLNEERGAGAQKQIGKQIVLPWSKAIEISFKAMQTRFWRSIITMSSIVLAIAFLMSIWTAAAVVNSLRTVPEDEARRAEGQVESARQLFSAPSLDAEQQSELQALAATALAAAEENVAVLRQLVHSIERVPEDTRIQAKKDQLAAARPSLERGERTLQVLTGALSSGGGVGTPSPELAEAVRHALESRALRNRGRAEDIKQALFKQEGIEVQEGEGSASGSKTGAHGPFGFIMQMKAKDRWLVFLALLVCFVGIVNAMLMSVSERFREIGTMKCLGALDSFIVKLFLLESSFQGLAGTLIGIVIGFALSLFRASLAFGRYTYHYFPGADILLSVGLSLIAGVILSVLAAVYPARTAARMEPVEAMRIEE